MKQSVRKVIGGVVILICLVSFSACGYFLYPERRGQTDGKIDVVILALDCAGFLFGILPGAIALAVDFSSGAIYLPDGKKSEIRIIHADKILLAKNGYLEAVVSEHLGKNINLDENVVWVKPSPGEDVGASLSSLNRHISDYRTIARFVNEHGQYYASGEDVRKLY